VNRVVRETLTDPKSEEVIVKEGERITDKMLTKIKKLKKASHPCDAVCFGRVEYLSADAEDKFFIAQANTPLNEFNELINRTYLEPAPQRFH